MIRREEETEIDKSEGCLCGWFWGALAARSAALAFLRDHHQNTLLLGASWKPRVLMRKVGIVCQTSLRTHSHPAGVTGQH